jgi:hypothetical protein
MTPNKTLQRVLLCICALIALQSGPAFAQRQNFRTIWVVADRMDGKVPDAGGAPERMVLKSGNVFLMHRLLPLSAALLESDMIDEKGAILIPKGGEMFALDADGAKIFCSARQSKPNAAMSLLVGNAGLGHACAIDRDGDGRFDAHFTARGLVKGLPSIDGRMPKAPKSVTGGTYSALAPAQMAAHYFVGIEYEGKPLLYDRRNFRITFGEGDRHESLSDWSFVSGKSYPQSLELMGSKFTIIEEKDGVLDVQIDRTMPRQPFNVRVTFEYR